MYHGTSMRRRFVPPLIPERLVISGVFLLVLAGGAFASNESIPPESWVYPALRTFELIGVVHLEPTLPYSRSDVEYYLNSILNNVDRAGIELTDRQEFLLDRLRSEFQGMSRKPAAREDSPLYLYRAGKRFFAFDLSAGGAILKTADSEKGEADGLLVPGMLFDIGDRLTLETTYRLRIAPERELNRRKQKPGPRVKSFRGLTAEYERAYISLRGGMWSLTIGRDYLHWGSGRGEGLLMSRTAGSIDHLAARFSIGRFSLHMVHAVLDPLFPRRLAGHRLTVRLPRGIYLGIGETVLYTGRDFEFAYLLPVGSFYSNQYNELGDDNILWSIDWKVPVMSGLLLYGEFLIDDFQYECDPPAPDRLGFDVAAEALLGWGGREIEVEVGYTYIDIFTYAHKDPSRTRYVTGQGDPAVNTLIGSSLGPDSDRWRFRVSLPVHRRVIVSAAGSMVRRGSGNSLREWDRIEDPDPPFPSGDVVTEKEILFLQSIDLSGGSTFSAGGGWRTTSAGGEDETEGFAFIELILDL